MRRYLVLLLFLGVAAPLLACYGPEYYSVHFNSARPDFFQMPQPWPARPAEPRALPGAFARYNRQEGKPPPYDIDAFLHERFEPNPLKWAHQAVRLESSGRFHQAAAAWVRYQK